ncbi:hypothetical protein D0815_22990 [Vibrio parahaemolyticus]|nr:hypothetical protein [Vibrio parahaemolyticus]
MSNQKINPEKVTKPIQLLAAWLAGLIIVNSAFLLTATTIGVEHWSSSALVIAAIINVPLFLAAIFLLQTKFRPEMQEDSYYSKYLETRVSTETGQLEIEVHHKQTEHKDVRDQLEVLTEKFNALSSHVERSKEIEELSTFTSSILESIDEEYDSKVLVNDLLPQYSQVLDGLKEAKVSISDVFGSTNKNKVSIPRVFSISFGDEVDVKVLQKIIEVCTPLGATTLIYAKDDYAEGKIYIGSYGYEVEDRNQFKIDNESYKQLMDNHLSLSKLKYLVC